jgi:hypothetical protein
MNKPVRHDREVESANVGTHMKSIMCLMRRHNDGRQHMGVKGSQAEAAAEAGRLAVTMG